MRFQASSFFQQLSLLHIPNGNLSATILERPVILQNGSSYSTRERFGDYFTLTVDPSERGILWGVGDYHQLKSGDWSTVISRLIMPTTTQALGIVKAVKVETVNCSSSSSNIGGLLTIFVILLAVLVFILFLILYHRNKSKTFYVTISTVTSSETFEDIVIIGTNFGAKKGVVLFGERVLSNDNEIVSWNDALIKIKINRFQEQSYKTRVITADNNVTPIVKCQIRAE